MVDTTKADGLPIVDFGSAPHASDIPIPTSDHVMPELGWVEEAWGADPGSMGWAVGQRYSAMDNENEPGSLQVILCRSTWFTRKFDRRPRQLTYHSMSFRRSRIEHLTPEQTADLAVYCANRILDKIRADLPSKTDVNGLTNVEFFGEGIRHTTP